MGRRGSRSRNPPRLVVALVVERVQGLVLLGVVLGVDEADAAPSTPTPTLPSPCQSSSAPNPSSSQQYVVAVPGAAGRLQRHRPAARRALPYLEDLCQVTRENVLLAVREGGEIVFVERIAGSTAVPVLTRVGGRLPITATGVGLVLLAHAPVDVQEDILAGPFERHTSYTVTDPMQLRRMLADVRATGFGVSDRQLSDETVSVAAPVHDDRRRVVAAVSLVVRHPTSISLLVPPLLTSARAISRAIMGWVPPTGPPRLSGR